MTRPLLSPVSRKTVERCSFGLGISLTFPLPEMCMHVKNQEQWSGKHVYVRDPDIGTNGECGNLDVLF